MARPGILNRKASNVAVDSYQQLRKHVQETLSLGRRRAQEAVERQKALTYWEVGGLIDRHVLNHGDRGDYGKQVIKRLSADLKTNQTLLYYALQFAREYKDVPSSENLTWSHYRALLPVKDEYERRELESQVETWGWSSRTLESAVAGVRKHGKATAEKLKALGPSDGTLNIGRLASSLPGKGLVLDLGFRTYIEFSERLRKNFFDGDIVAYEVSSGGGFKINSLRRAHEDKKNDLYLFRAFIERVIDGDTLAVSIDIGCGIWVRQRLRLRLINAQPRQTELGEEAAKFMSRHLPKGKEIRIRTVKAGKYDRYLADVFDGNVYLNQMLITKKLAVPFL